MCKRHFLKGFNNEESLSKELDILKTILYDQYDIEKYIKHAISTANNYEKEIIQNDIDSWIKDIIIPSIKGLDYKITNSKLSLYELFTITHLHFRHIDCFNEKHLLSPFKKIAPELSPVFTKIKTGLYNADEFRNAFRITDIGDCISTILNSRNRNEIYFYLNKMVYQYHHSISSDDTEFPALTIIDADDAINKIINEYKRRITQRYCLTCGAPLKLFRDICSKYPGHNCVPK